MSRPVADTPPFMARMIVGLVAALIVIFLAWAAIAEIDEIARGEGKVIPVSKTQIVQSSEAGVVETIAVQVGQVVRKGELIVQLNNTTTESSLGESVAKARALGAKIARLALEETGSYDAAFVCPQEVEKVASKVCENEERLFSANKAAFLNKAGVLKERVRQRENELSEAQANIVRLEQNIAQSTRQFDLMSPLAKKGLVAQTELISLERELTDQRGQITVYQESLERLRGAVEEARLQVDELALQLRQQALTEKPRRWPSFPSLTKPSAGRRIASAGPISALRSTASSTRWKSTRSAPMSIPEPWSPASFRRRKPCWLKRRSRRATWLSSPADRRQS